MVKNSQSWDPLLNAAKTYLNYWKDIKRVLVYDKEVEYNMDNMQFSIIQCLTTTRKN